MRFRDEDKILIKNLQDSKGYRGYGAKKTTEFPERSRSKSGLSCSVVSTGDKCVDDLKRQLIDVWCGLEQSIFDEATDQWRGRL